MMLIPNMIKESSTIYVTCVLHQLTDDSLIQQKINYFIFVIYDYSYSSYHKSTQQFITMGTLFFRSIQSFSDLCNKVLWH